MGGNLLSEGIYCVDPCDNGLRPCVRLRAGEEVCAHVLVVITSPRISKVR